MGAREDLRFGKSRTVNADIFGYLSVVRPDVVDEGADQVLHVIAHLREQFQEVDGRRHAVTLTVADAGFARVHPLA